ncbi:ribonuclease HII [Listeria floridensis FSL S10-1187]|uniref:Ribonuclease HII n=1 Tax=Listeria floridensis FSL S10-1187 TaxID=1265817 RepID=A0ABN0RCG5_9LIST|nr:ribonuclease HII [Listeria floridensis FSL S10-1187]
MKRFIKKKGFLNIAGVDEVGRGPLAGPVVAAAVILPDNFMLLGMNDSKQLSEAKRNDFYEQIMNHAVASGVGIVSHETIDKVNIYEATKIAMTQALDALKVPADYTLIDAMPLHYSENESSIIKGDAKSISIAAASIIAKVTRDRMMVEFDQLYPGYDFASNMGYGTKKHLEGLRELGPCPIHRLSFAPVKSCFAKKKKCKTKKI